MNNNKIIDIIEECLRNRVLFLGEEVPEFFTSDKRSKQVYLGSPTELLEEILNKLGDSGKCLKVCCLLGNTGFEAGYKKGVQEVLNKYDYAFKTIVDRQAKSYCCQQCDNLNPPGGCGKFLQCICHTPKQNEI